MYGSELSQIKMDVLIIIILYMNNGDHGSTVFKVLCYKSEGRWFDPS